MMHRGFLYKNMSITLDGKKVAKEIREELKEKVSKLSVKPCLAIIQIGNDERSAIYIRRKREFGESIGVLVRLIQLHDSVEEIEVEKVITELNEDKNIHG